MAQIGNVTRHYTTPSMIDRSSRCDPVTSYAPHTVSQTNTDKALAKSAHLPVTCACVQAPSLLVATVFQTAAAAQATAGTAHALPPAEWALGLHPLAVTD